MYNPEAKDVDLVRDYSPVCFGLCSRFEGDPLNAALNQFTELAMKRKYA